MLSYVDLTNGPGQKTKYLWSKDEVHTALHFVLPMSHANFCSVFASLVFINMGYPGITPLEGMASRVVVMVQHLQGGSPATFYCIHSLFQKASQLCSEVFTHEADAWKRYKAYAGMGVQRGKVERKLAVRPIAAHTIATTNASAENSQVISLIYIRLEITTKPRILFMKTDP
ncbi:hypothetical protein TanjilG_24377 [Lupinus angustifolius]|uniref:Uncharacterized protein n=1 Tax=Lupinus angustifolius TaxID=3871 RepID=A0A1J7H5Z3_LUPAN|nr:hypothetical protein TanjilG_24377 [Lupinus angustifolius]